MLSFGVSGFFEGLETCKRLGKKKMDRTFQELSRNTHVMVQGFAGPFEPQTPFRVQGFGSP